MVPELKAVGRTPGEERDKGEVGAVYKAGIDRLS